MRLLGSYRPWRTAAYKPHPTLSVTSLTVGQVWLLCSALLPGLVQEPALAGPDPDTQLQPAGERVVVVGLGALRGICERYEAHVWHCCCVVSSVLLIVKGYRLVEVTLVSCCAWYHEKHMKMLTVHCCDAYRSTDVDYIATTTS